MGVLLSSLAKLSVDDEVDWYIFVVNGRWNEPLYNAIRDNFENIAEAIGDRAVIAKSFRTTLWEEVGKAYLGKGWRDYSGLLPAIVVTNSHPEAINKNTMRLVVSLSSVKKKYGSWHEFFRTMSEFVRGESEEFIHLLQTREDALDAVSRVISIKPGFLGVSINVNEALSLWKKKRGAQRLPYVQ